MTYDAIITDSCDPSCYTMRSRWANTSGSASRSSALCEMNAGIYPVAEYAKSDSWMVCAKAAGRDVMVPVPRRTLVGRCRYYNASRGVRAAPVWAGDIGGGAD